jgi:hypothetical protein
MGLKLTATSSLAKRRLVGVPVCPRFTVGFALFRASAIAWASSRER